MSVRIQDFVKFAEVIQKSLDNRSRVFVIGNGGSYDNARCFADFYVGLVVMLVLRFADSYIDIAIEQTYENIISIVWARKPWRKDVLITLSGSGIENIIRAIDYTFGWCGCTWSDWKRWRRIERMATNIVVLQLNEWRQLGCSFVLWIFIDEVT